jgi:hypothetical protein
VRHFPRIAEFAIGFSAEPTENVFTGLRPLRHNAVIELIRTTTH